MSDVLRPAATIALAAALFAGCSGSTEEGEGSATTATAAATPTPASRGGEASPPNIVVVVVDDLRWDEFGAAGHPYLETPNIDRLAAEGAMFLNSFHAVPLCSPNRASLLTGQYPSRHGIIDNVARNLASHGLETFPKALHANGYETGFFGKWHMGNDPTPRPGFDEWAALPGQGRSENPIFYEDGALHEVEGYTTDLLTDRAVEFMRRERDGPFLVYLSHKAVHPDIAQRDDGSVDPATSRGFVPAPRHLGRYDEEVFPRRANVITSLSDLDGTPALQRALTRRGDSDPVDVRDDQGLGTNEKTIRRRSEMLLAVDEGLGRMIDALEELGILDETVIVFTSDNGYFYGEHGLTSERRMPYEESIRNPLIIRYPPRVDAGARPEKLVSSIDLAPTVLELAGAPIGPHIQGRSVVPLLEGRVDDWRESLLVEFYTYENPFPHLVDMDYRAIRTERFKYIHWMKYPDFDELYDLEADPFEIDNLADDPEFSSVRSELRRELGRLVLEAMDLGMD